MAKTILAEVNGFTPIMDGLVSELGLITAAVFGKMWRYCQMADHVCKASQNRIADELKITRQTVNKHITILVEHGYLRDITPDLAGIPHTYMDTGKAALSITLTATNQNDGHLNEATCQNALQVKDDTCQNNLQPPVKHFDKKKELKKVLTTTTGAAPNVFEMYSSNFGAITQMAKDTLIDLVETYTAEWVVAAMVEAVKAEARKLKYVESILRRWQVEGFKSERRKANDNKPGRTQSGKLSNDDFKQALSELAEEYQNV